MWIKCDGSKWPDYVPQLPQRVPAEQRLHLEDNSDAWKPRATQFYGREIN